MRYPIAVHDLETIKREIFLNDINLYNQKIENGIGNKWFRNYWGYKELWDKIWDVKFC